jgi:alcohol dehydrogenase YqhD (iron-dependent ADH family)
MHLENFTCYHPTKIIFGKGTEKQARREAARFGTRVLLHHYGDEIARSHRWDFFAGRAEVKETLPVGMVRPKFAILNPKLTFTLSPYQTTSGGCDILSHTLERYFPISRNVDLTDKLCEAVLKTVIKNLPLALERPDDYDARAELLWAGSIWHNDLVGTERGSPPSPRRSGAMSAASGRRCFSSSPPGCGAWNSISTTRGESPPSARRRGWSAGSGP